MPDVNPREHSIKSKKEFTFDPDSEANFKAMVYTPTKTKFDMFEFDELVSAELSISFIPKELQPELQEWVQLKRSQAALYLSMAGPWSALALLSLKDIIGVCRLYDSTEGVMMHDLLAPPQRASVRTHLSGDKVQSRLERLFGKKERNEMEGL